MKKSTIIFLGVLAVIAIIVGIFFPEWPQEKEKRENFVKQCGEKKDKERISNGTATMFICEEYQQNEKLISAEIKNYKYGMNEIINGGGCHMIKSCQSVIKLEPGVLFTKVRIVIGENTGMAGWILSEHLEK